MYALYIVFLMTFLMSLAFGLNAPTEQKMLRPEVVAMQMSSWHVAAQKKCSLETCNGGTVNPVNYLNDMVKNAEFVTRGYFKTNYDLGSKYVLTSLTGVGMSAGNINNATVSSSFHKLLGGDSSSSIGYWDQTKKQIELPSRRYGKTNLSVPGDISANLLIGVPDKSPVMINKIVDR